MQVKSLTILETKIVKQFLILKSIENVSQIR